MSKNYNIEVWEEDGHYLAKCPMDNGTAVTWGENKEMLWHMIGDAILTMEDEHYPWYKKLAARIYVKIITL